jgi:PBP1b-binding outer membrane lipoprotein LpoB
MHRYLLLALGVLALSGCSQVVSDINSVTGALSSPQATQAAANLKAGATALICDVGSVADLTAAIEAQVKAGKAAIRDSENVYVIAGSVCSTLGGTVVGPVIVPAGVTSGS